MTSEGNSVGKEEVKRYLNQYFEDGDDLKHHLLRQFGSFARAGRVVGWNESRVHQICIGYKVPVTTDLIKKLADAWHIDLVVLTTIFTKLREGSC